MTDSYKSITVNSFDRSAGTDTNFDVSLNGTFREEFKQICLGNLIMTNTLYNVDSTNNTLVFQENTGSAVTATISAGNYSIVDLIPALQTAMNAVSVNSRTYIITSSNVTMKLTITGSAGTFSVLSTGGLNLMLGFSRSTATGQNLANTGSRIFNLSRYPYLNVYASCVRGDTFNTITGNREGCLSFVSSAESGPGDMLVFRPQAGFEWRDVLTPYIDAIHFRIADKEGTTIDLNGGFCAISLLAR